jgi:hypothetical protein
MHGIHPSALWYKAARSRDKKTACALPRLDFGVVEFVRVRLLLNTRIGCKKLIKVSWWAKKPMVSGAARQEAARCRDQPRSQHVDARVPALRSPTSPMQAGQSFDDRVSSNPPSNPPQGMTAEPQPRYAPRSRHFTSISAESGALSSRWRSVALRGLSKTNLLDEPRAPDRSPLGPC